MINTSQWDFIIELLDFKTYYNCAVHMQVSANPQGGFHK